MDALDKEIESRRAERAQCEARVKELDIVLSALEHAASLRPATRGIARERNQPVNVVASVVRDAPKPRKGGGRRKGDISKEWRNILDEVHKLGSPQSYQEIADVAEILGVELQMPSVRDRVRNLVRTGFLVGDADTGFVVTQVAVERFGFTKQNEPPKGGSDTGEVDASSDQSEQDVLGDLLGKTS